MAWYSIVAIYALFWVLCAFIMLAFGIRTHHEEGVELTPGQADSAPANFRPGRVIVRATILSAIVTAAFVANYQFGWITRDDIDMLGKPPHMSEVQRGNDS